MKKLRVTVNGTSYEVDVEVLEDDEVTTGASPSFPSASRAAGGAGNSTVQAAPPASQPAAPAAAPASGGGGELTSPIAGVVVDVKVAVGAAVQAGDPVIIIEAMKMNTNVSAPVTGTVKEVKVSTGDAVQQGQVLVTFG